MVSDRDRGGESFRRAIALFEVLARWKRREAGSAMHLKIAVTQETGEEAPELFFNHSNCFFMMEQISRSQHLSSECNYEPLGSTARRL